MLVFTKFSAFAILRYTSYGERAAAFMGMQSFAAHSFEGSIVKVAYLSLDLCVCNGTFSPCSMKCGKFIVVHLIVEYASGRDPFSK